MCARPATWLPIAGGDRGLTLQFLVPHLPRSCLCFAYKLLEGALETGAVLVPEPCDKCDRCVLDLTVVSVLC